MWKLQLVRDRQGRTEQLFSKLGSGLVLAIVCSWVALVPSASAAVECGDVILSDKVLKKDLNCRKSDSDVGLEVGADDVTLDLGDHTIIGNSRQAGVRVQGRSGVKVTNGSLRTFGVGVQAGGGDQTTVSKLTIKGSDEHGVHLQDAAQTTIQGNTIVASERNITVAGMTSATVIAKNGLSGGEVGVDVTQGSNATVRDNFITGSTEAAVSVGGSGFRPDTTLIEGNVLDRNEGVGVRIQGTPSSIPIEVSIVENEILESDDAGIEVFTGASIGISANVLLENGHGIIVFQLQGESTSPNAVSDNVVKRSTFDGIDIHDLTIGIAGNQAIANGRFGIRSSSSNGGNNVARRNGEEPQCQPASLCE
jgi:nitrous oxidase accessory protein NosD